MRHTLLAWFAFLLGLLAVPFQALLGIPALALGFYALRGINETGKEIPGRLPAMAAMVFGGFGILFTLLGFFWVTLATLWESSARLNCANHLRALGHSTSLYFDANGELFPRPSLDQKGLAVNQCLSWLADPIFLDARSRKVAAGVSTQIDYASAWNSANNAAVARQRIGHYLCPAVTKDRAVNGESCTAYLGISGLGQDSAIQETVDAQSGYFNHNRVFRLKDFTRGMGNILQAMESNHQNGPWMAAGEPTLRFIPMQASKCIGPGLPFGGCHTGGAYGLLADGSVRFLPGGIDPAVLRSLATIQEPPIPPGLEQK
ncbi:MAG: DUF1559 domain-containing protein [Gemmataceae bacterium]|nr:DUF1559 domain-containing protein [Gemmataceae bacterium]